ncbi:hypothetical protein GWK47_033974 [Chionoecetes opilio]|uniref:Uncharacterized protein n=1 Tax=Chionoecetes opilio TaxID=41210 RepID=A0A8J4YGT1_CHIOP|nr:hypothetical protein GWK47_033974 [Chionoecetes opilio]
MATVNRRYLIAPLQNIAGSQIPSEEEVLGLLICRIEVKKKSVREAANDVVKIVIELWLKARIPFQRKDTILAKIEKLHKEFGNVKRNMGRAGSQAVREEVFKKRTKNLFDVAATNALDVLTNEEDKAFLLTQRKPGRRGQLGSVDTRLAAVEARAAQRRELQERQRQRAEDEASTSMTPVELESSSISADETAEEESGDDEEARPPKRPRRAMTNVITPSVAACLDRTKMTDRGAVHVLSAAAHSLGHDVSKLNINRSSIRRHRRKHRTDARVALKEELRGGCTLIVLWDGKLMQNLTTKKNVERLPILVSGNGTVQLLNVLKLPNGTGSEMAKAVVGALEDWDLTERIGGMSFDTTSSNTGRNNGACVLIEQQLKKYHHWKFIDRSQFEPGDSHPHVRPLLDPVEKNWFQSTLINHKGLRDDYRELLELTVIFLGQELVALALFDPLVTVEEKRQILTSLHITVGDESPAKRPKLPSQAVSGLQLQDMASTNTRRFFQKLRLEDGFLDADPATWLEREDFRTAAAFVEEIAVINDHAERGVALIQEYNRRLTQDEEQLQFLLQVVSRHRAKFPDSRKKTVAVGVAAHQEQEH